MKNFPTREPKNTSKVNIYMCMFPTQYLQILFWIWKRTLPFTSSCYFSLFWNLDINKWDRYPSRAPQASSLKKVFKFTSARRPRGSLPLAPHVKPPCPPFSLPGPHSSASLFFSFFFGYIVSYKPVSINNKYFRKKVD